MTSFEHADAAASSIPTLLEARTFTTVAPAVEVSRFDSTDFPVRDQYSMWRTAVAASFGTIERPAPHEAPFPAFVKNYLTTKAGYAHHHIGCAASVRRDEKAIAHGNFDGIGLQYRLAGVEVENSFRHGTVFSPGQIRVHDLSKPFSSGNHGYENIALIVGRNHLADRVPGLAHMNGLVLPTEGAMAMLLRDHMRSSMKVLTRASKLEAERLSDVTLEVVVAALLSTDHPDILASETMSGALMWAIQACIGRNLHRAGLSPDFIARSVGVSRAKLYRACKPQGTPMELVQVRRLSRAAEIIKADPDKRITDVAAMVGYDNLETFSRAFKRTYGYSAQDFKRAFGKPPRPC